MIHLLITGGAGFIGSNFIHYMMERHPNLKITVVDKLTYAGNLGNLEPLLSESRLRFVKGCITDKPLFEKLIKDAEYLINFASESHVDRSIQDASPFVKTNVDGVRNLLEVMKHKKEVPFLQISTDEVYGSSEKDEFNREIDPLRPGNPYAASKASAEMFIQAYQNTFGIQSRILRLTNNFGPRQNREKLIPKAITNFISGTYVPVYGTGEQARDWIYVNDSCKAIEKIMFNGNNGEIYNVSTMKTHSNMDVIDWIRCLLKADKELIKHVDDRLGHDFKYLVDSTKIRTTLKWEPEWEFMDGLVETVRWYTKNL